MKKQVLILFLVCVLVAVGCNKNKNEVSLSPEDKGTDKEMYERALNYIKRDPEKSRLLFKEVMQVYPASIYAKKSKIGIADSYFKEKDASALIIASTEYQEYVNLYPQSPDAVYAKLQIGMCFYSQMKSPGRDQTNTFALITAFESLIKQYPGTKEAEDAKKIITEARQNLATHFFKIGYYNYKYKAYNGAVARFKQVLDDYPDFEETDKLFYYTGRAYSALRDYDSAKSFYQQILTRYPKSKYAGKAARLIKNTESAKKQLD